MHVSSANVFQSRGGDILSSWTASAQVAAVATLAVLQAIAETQHMQARSSVCMIEKAFWNIQGQLLHDGSQR